jgi:hypothetical protein
VVPHRGGDTLQVPPGEGMDGHEEVHGVEHEGGLYEMVKVSVEESLRCCNFPRPLLFRTSFPARAENRPV